MGWDASHPIPFFSICIPSHPMHPIPCIYIFSGPILFHPRRCCPIPLLSPVLKTLFSVLRPFSYLRPFLYFDPPTLLRPKPYFDLFGQTLLRPKLYFDQNCTSTCTSRPIRCPNFIKGRSTEVEVNGLK